MDELINEEEIKRKKREEKRRIEEEKKAAYFAEYPNQDYKECGDCYSFYSPWIRKDKYFIENPKHLFSEQEPLDWKNNTFYYVYKHKNKKYVRFISTLFVDNDFEFARKEWDRDICHKEIEELRKFGIDRNVYKLLVDDNIVEQWSYEDPYDALNYANIFLHLGAKKLWISDLTENTKCGYYYDSFIGR